MTKLQNELAAAESSSSVRETALDALERRATRRALLNRLREKIRNDEREAARLDIRGRHDDAEALLKTARRRKNMLRKDSDEDL